MSDPRLVSDQSGIATSGPYVIPAWQLDAWHWAAAIDEARSAESRAVKREAEMQAGER